MENIDIWGPPPRAYVPRTNQYDFKYTWREHPQDLQALDKMVDRLGMWRNCTIIPFSVGYGFVVTATDKFFCSARLCFVLESD